MNLLRIILPLVLTAALAFQIASQRGSIGVLEREIRLLRETTEARSPRHAASIAAVRNRPSDPESDETGGSASRSPSALAAWAAMDPAAAAAWLDLRISEGHFETKSLDGVSEALTEYEAALCGALLSAAAGLAELRLAALPEEQRRDVLGRIGYLQLDPDGRSAYVGLLRGMIRENEAAVSFDPIVSELVPAGGFAGVGDFLDAIHASPAERALAAAQAAGVRFEEIAEARAITQQDFDGLRKWLERQSPENAAIVSATVLAGVTEDAAKFSVASRLLLDSGGGDEILAVFLSQAGYSNLPEALELAARIADPELREKAIGDLTKNAAAP